MMVVVCRQYASLVVAGWADGTIVVYDVCSTDAPVAIYSTPVDGKHLLPVTRVSDVHVIEECVCNYSLCN